MKLIISCEHASSAIPSDYQHLFKHAGHDLITHKAIDFGAKHLAEALRDAFQCPCVLAETSRLLIDFNRSLTNRHCFSDYTSKLNAEQKKSVIDTYYKPYRTDVETHIHEAIQKKQRVLHLSVHSFTPIFEGVVRNADVGLLYDPRRTHEKSLAEAWKKHLVGDDGLYRVRMNYPYRGSSDGFTSALRKQYDDEHYIGLELEVNQRLVMVHPDPESLVQITARVIQSLKTVFSDHGVPGSLP
ncbi:MAG: N-formylglutamate amidohydrolase [Legionella sp.]|jgi:predicted N-formylglutamate amidohydrolase|nr:N-formylglutamate amidohydrolase [Legionella sp.]